VSAAARHVLLGPTTNIAGRKTAAMNLANCRAPEATMVLADMEP